jgi:hypothetical protein
MQAAVDTFRQTLASGDTPAEIANAVFTAIRDEKFYIINDPRAKDGTRKRMADILEDRNPALDPQGIRAAANGTGR